MVELSDADKRSIFGADYKPVATMQSDVVDARNQAKRKQSIADSMKSTGWLIAFVATAYSTGNFFSVMAPYDPALAFGSAAIALVGVAIAIAGVQYAKRA